jgi:hypothetical protein
MTLAYFPPWISFLLCCLLVIFWETMSYVQWRLWRSFIINYSTLDSEFSRSLGITSMFMFWSQRRKRHQTQTPIKGERSITKSGEVLARQKRSRLFYELGKKNKIKHDKDDSDYFQVINKNPLISFRSDLIS